MSKLVDGVTFLSTGGHGPISVEIADAQTATAYFKRDDYEVGCNPTMLGWEFTSIHGTAFRVALPCPWLSSKPGWVLFEQREVQVCNTGR